MLMFYELTQLKTVQEWYPRNKNDVEDKTMLRLKKPRIRLLEDYIFFTDQGFCIVPKDFVCDGISRPFGDRFGIGLPAALGHDKDYLLGVDFKDKWIPMSKEDVDDRFFVNLYRIPNLSTFMAWSFYIAVRIGAGSAWREHRQNDATRSPRVLKFMKRIEILTPDIFQKWATWLLLGEEGCSLPK